MTAARAVVPATSAATKTSSGIRRQPFAAYSSAVGSGSHGASITDTIPNRSIIRSDRSTARLLDG